MSKKRFLLSIVLAGLYLFPGVFAHGQAYTSIVVFGDSLSDTGNDAAQSLAKYGPSASVPSPATGYTQGSFTDGLDTVPAARNYTGVWIAQVAASLAAHPAVKNSLAGGTNYAYGFATTDVGTSEFDYGPGNALSFTVNNIGQQVTDYLATNPTITNKTLFVVWGGANDLINATSSADIVAAAQRDAAIVQRLITAGATDIIVPNLPPLGLVPRFNGSAATSTEPTEAAAGFNQALAAYLAGIPAANPGKTLHIFQLDVYTIFNTIVGPPIADGFKNVTMSSQGNSSIDPDTYLFWDDLHPTTFGHSILASTAETLIGTPVVTTTAVTSSDIDANLNASVTLTASVVSTSGTAMGYVTFLDGTTTLGTVLLSGSTTTATAAFTTSALTAGTHSITATYTGDNGYVSSASSAISEVVTAPALNSALLPASVSVAAGGIVTTTLNFTPVGGYTGSVTLGCTTTAPHMSCVPASTSVTFDGTNKAQSVLVTVSTASTTTTAATTAAPASHSGEVIAAFLVFPCLGFMGLAGLRKRKLGARTFGPLLLLAIVSGGALFALTGCGNGLNPNDTHPGTYTVLVTETASGVVTTQTLTVVVH
jgi:phospholipase/lecithinase/hemolysin